MVYTTLVAIAQGEHLLRGLTVDDYFVQIENVSCNISSLSNSRLWFRPSQLVVPDQTYFAQRWQCPNDYPYHVVVGSIITVIATLYGIRPRAEFESLFAFTIRADCTNAG